MFPIKITENEYVNPDAVLFALFTPNGASSSDPAVFVLVFEDPEVLDRVYKGPEAEEAFENWKRAYARQTSTLPSGQEEPL